MRNTIASHLRARRNFALALILLLATLVAVSACGGGAAPTSAPQRAVGGVAPAAQATSAPAATSAPSRGLLPAATSALAPTALVAGGGANSSVSGVSNPIPLDRRIIKNAQLTETVQKADLAVQRVTTIAQDVGGYVGSSHTFREGDHQGAQVTIAVPVDRFEEVLNLVRKIGHVDQDVATSSDVSDQYVDLESRLKNLEATAARIRDFLGKAQTVDEAIKINAQLSSVEEQIEQIKGKLNVLSARTAFSTITIDIHEELPTPTPTATPTMTPTPTPVGWHPDETFKSAVNVQSSLLRSLGDLLIWFFVVLLPYVVVFALVAMGVAWIARRFSRAPTRAP